MEISAVTDVGRQRKNNEDSYFTYHNDMLVGGMVADGMGGHNCGEVASKMASDLIKQYIITQYDPKMDYMEIAELIRIAFVKANTEIYNKSLKEEYLGMGTTATLAMVYNKKLITAHVGDSRCYKIINNKIKQITNDHSFVAELLRKGQISEIAAQYHPNKNVITRALGAESFIKIDMNIQDYDNQAILLCSDGLTNMLSDTQITEILNENENLDDALQKMVTLANKKGGNDNITVVAFRNLKGETKR